MKSKTAALVFLVMLALATALPSVGVAQAAGPQSFGATGFAIVTDMGVSTPLGNSSRLRTVGEKVSVLPFPILAYPYSYELYSSEWPELNGGWLVADHASNVLKTLVGGYPVYGGTSHGTFYIQTPAGDLYQGFYESRISTRLSDAEYVVQDSGNWVINSGGVHARGTLNVRLSMVQTWWGEITLGGEATMSGQYQYD